ncbi:MAG: hypothetical protein ICV72_00065 [Aldersonia sp.]|nr:hypothetical protein [Aldersonia sp.]
MRSVDRSQVARSAAARRAISVLVPLMCLLPAACGADTEFAHSSQPDVVVGSGDSSASEILAAIYAETLARSGSTVRTDLALGDRPQYLAALDAGRITLVPEQSGALLDYLNPNAPATDSDDVYAALNRSLPEDLSVSDYADAEVGAPTRAETAVAQNVLPLFRKGSLSDAETKRLNVVAGELTTGELAELVDAVNAGRSARDAAREWLDLHGI